MDQKVLWYQHINHHHVSREQWQLASHPYPNIILSPPLKISREPLSKTKGTGTIILCHQTLTLTFSYCSQACLFHNGHINHKSACSWHGPTSSWSSFHKAKQRISILLMMSLNPAKLNLPQNSLCYSYVWKSCNVCYISPRNKGLHSVWCGWVTNLV